MGNGPRQNPVDLGVYKRPDPHFVFLFPTFVNTAIFDDFLAKMNLD